MVTTYMAVDDESVSGHTVFQCGSMRGSVSCGRAFHAGIRGMNAVLRYALRASSASPSRHHAGRANSGAVTLNAGRRKV